MTAETNRRRARCALTRNIDGAAEVNTAIAPTTANTLRYEAFGQPSRGADIANNSKPYVTTVAGRPTEATNTDSYAAPTLTLKGHVGANIGAAITTATANTLRNDRRGSCSGSCPVTGDSTDYRTGRCAVTTRATEAKSQRPA